MHRIFFIQFILLLSLAAVAQERFTDRIQRSRLGGGTLIIRQSSKLNDLVNGHMRNFGGGSFFAPSEADDTPVAPTQKMAADGFRVQVISADKKTAEAMQKRLQAKFSDMPIFLNFQSPHWQCRVGNFETRDEATECMKMLRKEGFKESIVVRCKIVVYY